MLLQLEFFPGPHCRSSQHRTGPPSTTWRAQRKGGEERELKEAEGKRRERD